MLFVLWQVINDSIRLVAGNVSITRVDFFVQFPGHCGDGGWPSDLGRVRINEVEHGFDAGLIPSWFGQQMAELISKAWILLGLLCP